MLWVESGPQVMMLGQDKASDIKYFLCQDEVKRIYIIRIFNNILLFYTHLQCSTLKSSPAISFFTKKVPVAFGKFFVQ